MTAHEGAARAASPAATGMRSGRAAVLTVACLGQFMVLLDSTIVGAALPDMRHRLHTQLNGLQKQAKQANRYRTISQTIRTAEAELLSVQRARVERARDEAAEALRQAQEAVAAATEAAAAASSHATEATGTLPALREEEAEARTALERLRVAQEQIAAEEGRARTALAGAGRPRCRAAEPR